MNPLICINLVAISAMAYGGTSARTIPLPGGTSTEGSVSLASVYGQASSLGPLTGARAVLNPGFLCVEPSELGVLGDLNHDGFVGSADLVLLLNAWGSIGGTRPEDLNSDGAIDGADLSILLENWSH